MAQRVQPGPPGLRSRAPTSPSRSYIGSIWRIWCMVHGYMVHGIGTVYMVHGAGSMVQGIWYMVLGIWYLGLGRSFQGVLG